MTEENEPIMVNHDNNYLAIASEDTSLSGAELEAAGVDMRVTKADILELVTAQMKEQLEENFHSLMREKVTKEYELHLAVAEYAQETYPELFEVHKKVSGSPSVAWLGYLRDEYGRRDEGSCINIDNSKRVDLGKARKAMDKWLSSNSLENPYCDFREAQVNVLFRSKKKKREMYVHVHAEFELDEDALPENINEAMKARDAHDKAISECVRDYRDMHKVERKARYKLANKILSATKEGKKLLKNLNNFRTQKVRALKE